MSRYIRFVLFSILLATVFIFSACNFGQEPLPTPDVDAILTAAARTVAVEYTFDAQQTALAETAVAMAASTVMIETPVFQTNTAASTPTLSSCNPPDNWQVYTVQQGDTVSSLASSAGITVEELMRANCQIFDINRISAGETLYLPQQSVETPNPTQTLQAAEEEAKKQLDNANIAYNKPETMKKGDTVEVELLLDKLLSQGALATQVTERGGFVTSTAEPGKLVGPSGEEVTVNTANVVITDSMKALLFSTDKAFDIQKMSDEVQVVSPDTKTIWRWAVTANEEGPHKLELVLYRNIQDQQNNDHWTEVETYSDVITVEVTPMDKIKSLDWKWIAGIVITALLIPAFWRFIDSRKGNVSDTKKKTISGKRKK